MTLHQEQAYTRGYCFLRKQNWNISKSDIMILQVTYLNNCSTSWETGFSADISSLTCLPTSLLLPESPSASSQIISNLLCRLVMISPYAQNCDPAQYRTRSGRKGGKPVKLSLYCINIWEGVPSTIHISGLIFLNKCHT